MKHLTVAIPYFLLGGLGIFVGLAKLDHAAYVQCVPCLLAGAGFAWVGIQEARVWRRQRSQ